MNELPAAVDLLVERSPRARPTAGRRGARVGGRARSAAQLPLAWPVTRRPGVPSSSPAAPERPAAPCVDVIAAVAALGQGFGAPAGSLTRLDAPADGWPDALVRPGDAVLVAAGATVSDGVLAAVRVRSTGAVLLRRVYAAGALHVRLQPEQRTQPPLVVPTADVEMLGPVVTIVRAASTAASAGRRSA